MTSIVKDYGAVWQRRPRTGDPELDGLCAIADSTHEAAIERRKLPWIPLTVREAGGLALDLWVNGVSYERVRKVIELEKAATAQPNGCTAPRSRPA